MELKGARRFAQRAAPVQTARWRTMRDNASPFPNAVVTSTARTLPKEIRMFRRTNMDDQ